MITMINPKRDKGHKETDKRLAELEKKLTKEYEQASREVEEKLNNYLKRYEVKDAIKREQVRAGTLKKSEYLQWRKGQVMIGRRWAEMQDALANDMHNVNKIAKAMIDKSIKDAYALNHNYGTFEVEKGSLLDTSYTLYSRETVERLMRDNPEMLPPPQPHSKTAKRIKQGKDKLWNKQVIQSVMMQSVLQGEAMPKIAKRLAEAVGDKNRVSAIRNARTMTTGAQNAGRRDAYIRAQDLGIEVENEWIATLDPVTRDSHRDTDGERIPVGEDNTFSNGLRFPGDPYGTPAEVYNCRCVLQAVLKKYDTIKANDLNLRYNKDLGDMTYDEWKEGHNG